MTSEEELRMAWTLWHMLTQISEILWERYEDGFLRMSIEMNRRNVWEFGRSDESIHG